jgi:hypothetical protein
MSLLIPRWAAAIVRTHLSFVLAVVLAASIHSVTASAQTFVNSPFELDGNAVNNANDDWSNVFANGGSSSATTGLLADPSPASIFTQGGSKDPEDVTSWRYKNGSVPDKDDITNAYAASYTVPDGSGGQDLIIYFGADRLANDGDAQLGFWFFQAGVGQSTGGKFTGSHLVGDILILADFSGGGSVATIQLFEWVGSGGSHGSLDLKASGAKCDPLMTTAKVCAITNAVPAPAPWSYTPKSGSAGTFPEVSFFEGGVNITKVFGPGGLGGGTLPCFSSFLAETRSSTSTTAVLKDLVASGFPVCGIQLSKFCGGGDINSAGNGFVYTVGGSVKNTGFGTLYDVKITDMFPTGSTRADGTPLQASDGIFNIPSIGPNETLCWNGSDPTVTGTACTDVSVFSFGNANASTMNNATVVSAVSDGGAQTVTDTASSGCTGNLPDAEIEVTKTCSTTINSVNNALVIGVSFSGSVCNQSGLQLKNLVLKNNQPVNPTTLTPSKTTLPPYDANDVSTPPAYCATFSGSYTPAAGSPGVGRLSFSDTVTATANPTISEGIVITDMGGATCYLCLDENGAACPLPQ